MTGIRVLMVTPDYPPAKGGIQTLMGELAVRLPVGELRVLTLADSGCTAYDHAGSVDVRRSRVLASRKRARILVLSACSLLEAARFRPDVVLLGHVAVSPVGAVLRRTFGIPTVTYAHAEEFRVWPRRSSFAMRNTDAVIAVSRHSEVMAIASGASQDAVHVIHHGVDLPPEDARPQRSSRPTIITVARMTDPHKGHDVLLKAMPLILAKVPDARWVVVGDGARRPLYERQVRELGITGSVWFEGSVTDAERDTWLHTAHVFAMPTRVPEDRVGGEGFGIAYLEAAAHGLPVVASNEGGALDAVDPGRTGLLVNPTDHVMVAEALISLLTDPERAQQMGEAAVSWAGRFPWQATADRVAEVLTTVAAAAARH